MKIPRLIFKKTREQNKFTQRKLAELSGVTETTIRNIENNRTNPSFLLSIKLSKILDIKYEDLWKDSF